MEKRTLLAIILSVAVLAIYSAMVSRMYPVANKADTSKQVIISPPKELPAAMVSVTQSEVAAREYITAETDKFKIVFANPGAYISKVEFKEYNAQFFLEGLLLASDEQNCNFKAEKTPDAIIFTYRDNNREIIKRYSLLNHHYSIELERTVRYLNGEAPTHSYQLWLNNKVLRQSAQDDRFMELAISRQNEVGQAQPKTIVRKGLFALKTGLVSSGNFDWAGIRDRYFTFIVHPSNKGQGVFVQVAEGQPQVSLELESQGLVSPETKNVDKFTLYVGPQNAEGLAALNLGFENMLYFGFFDTISQMLLSVLKFLFGITHNWGGAILLFGFLIFLAMYPLTIKQMRSMKEMQLLQPKIKELQARLKGDSQKLNKEIMQLYKEHKVNPLGGCLPLLLQFPIFIALYQALMRFVGLRGAGFLWIKDLSQPDKLIMLPNRLPIIGNEINLLPILMMLSMFVQQKVSMSTMSGSSSAEQQKLMAIFMPLIFGMLFYSMPAALVLYWFVYGVLSGAQQWLLMRARRAE